MKSKSAVGLQPLGHPRLPKYVRLAEHFRREMQSGALRPGDRLPSFTQIGAQFGMSQHTFEKVHALLEQDGLISREPGRGVFVAEPPPARATCLLGVLTPGSVRENSYYVHLLRGVQNEAQRLRADVLLIPDDGGPHLETLDGVIMMGVRDFGMPNLPHGLPAVSVMQSIDGIPSVLMDDGQGIRDAVNHLLELGHRRISFLGSLPDGHADSQRLKAYARALVAGGVTPESQWVRPVHNVGEPLIEFVELGAQKMRSWLSQGWAAMGCTALLAQNDETAIGVIEALREVGIQVPQMVSVVGFDGLKVGKYFSPSLTTVRVPLEEVGARAVSLLMELASGGATTSENEPSNLLPVQLLVRESTAPCRAGRATT